MWLKDPPRLNGELVFMRYLAPVLQALGLMMNKAITALIEQGGAADTLDATELNLDGA